MSKESLLKKESYNFDDLCEVVKILRAPGGCPWDAEQTHQSIRKGLIEETYEVVEGIDKDDAEILNEELGDLLLQVVFHAIIGEENGRFDINSICDGICKKLIYRHPHVFSDVVAENSEIVLKNWEALKQKEKGQKSKAEVLNAVSSALPSLMRAQKLIKKSEIENERKDIIARIKANADRLEAGEDTAVTDIVFECARLANTASIDLEQALYNKNDDFLAENCTKN